LRSSSSLSTADLVSKDMLPQDDAALEQAKKAFADFAQGEKKIGAANQRMTYAIELHYANLLKVSNSVIPLKAYIVRDSDNKMTKDGQKLVANMIKDLAGAKPDTTKMTDQETMTANAEYARRGTLIRSALEIAAYREQYGCDWRMFNVQTNTLLFPAKMMYPATAKPAGRLLYSKIVDERMLPPDLVAADGGGIAYDALIAAGKYKTTPKQATIAHMLSCVKPKKAKVEGERTRETGETPTGKRPTDPMKPADLVRDSQAEVLMTALHTLLCGKDAGTRKLTLDSYTPAFWKYAMDIMMLIDSSRLAPDFGKVTTGRTIPKDVSAFFAAKPAA
jgi:hypothetical protein